MKMRLIVSLLVLVNCLVAASGCGKSGPPAYTVRGSITLDGQPLATGRINLVPSDGKGGTVGGDIKNGKYEVRILNGPKSVEITSEKVVGKQKAYPNDPQSPEFDVREPLKFTSKSDLKVEVKADNTTEANFELISDTPADTPANP